MPEGQTLPLKKGISFWIIAALVLSCLLVGLALLEDTNNAQIKQLEQSRLEVESMEFSYALQSSAQAYGRFLFNVQFSLTGDPIHDGRSLVDQWNIAIANPEFASTHILRMIPVGQDTLLGARISEAIQTHRGGIEVRAFAQDHGLTLVAIPASTDRTKDSPFSGTVIGVDLQFSEWLREVQRLATAYAIEVHAFVGHTPVPTAEMQPTMRWNKESLHIAMQIMGQRVELAFAPSAQLAPNNAISQALPWGLIITGLVLLLAWLVLLRMREGDLIAQSRSYRDHAYKGWMRYFAFVKHPLIPTAEIDRQNGYFHNLSPRFSQLLGYNQEGMQRLTIAAITHPDDLHKLHHPEVLQSPDQDYLYEKVTNLRLQHSLGHPVWVDLLRIRYEPSSKERYKHTLTDRDIVVLLDQSQSQFLQNQLHRRLEKNEKIFEQLPVGLCITDPQMRILFMNDRFKKFSNWQGQAPATLDDWWHGLDETELHSGAQERWQQQVNASLSRNGMLQTIELNLRGSHQAQYHILELSGIVLDDQMVLTLVDLTAHKKAEDDIRFLAFYDVTTELPNRRLLLDRLQQASINSVHNEQYGALLLLNLDKLHALRDDKNTELLDAALKETVVRLRRFLPPDQTIARTDTGEFAILLNGLADDEDEAVRQCEEIANKILDASHAPYVLFGRTINLHTFIGTSLFKGTNSSAEDLLDRAQMALRQSAQKGHNAAHFFDPHIQENVSARAALEENIKAGIAMSEFVLYYQPQVHQYQLTGAEVLLRWRHGDAFVSPDKFLSTAEQSNLILPLGNWVLHQACKQLAQWAKRSDTAHLTLSVNVSSKQFKQPQFVDIVLQAIANAGAPAHRLIIELTESILFEDIDNTIERMAQLHSYGVRFCFDDFGTGYSSLNCLHRLPLSEIKIDRSFIKEITSSASEAGLVRTIINLGHSMGLRVVAEGVETQQQLDYLKACNCYSWQGFFIGKPQPIESLEQLLQQPHIPAKHGASSP